MKLLRTQPCAILMVDGFDVVSRRQMVPEPIFQDVRQHLPNFWNAKQIYIRINLIRTEDKQVMGGIRVITDRERRGRALMRT